MDEPIVQPESVSAPIGASRRLPGIDMARALAIIGMFTVHVRPLGTDGALSLVLTIPRGRSAILFGLLAGVGVSLLVSSRTSSTTQARATLLWRAAILLPLGLALQMLDHRVFVILADYAVLFVLATVVLRWPDRWLLALAGVSATLGSAGYLYGRRAWPEAFAREPAQLGASFPENLHALVFSGPYPLITWAAPFCFGIWLGRRDLGTAGMHLRLAGIGGAVAVAVPLLAWGSVALAGGSDALVGWWQLLDDEPHSQTPLWLLSATGAAVAILGVSSLVAERWPRTVVPLAAAGRLAFTWYVAHLLALHAYEGLLRTGTIPGTFAVIGSFVIVMISVSAAWLTVFRQGPLESVLRVPKRFWRVRSGSRHTAR